MFRLRFWAMFCSQFLTMVRDGLWQTSMEAIADPFDGWRAELVVSFITGQGNRQDSLPHSAWCHLSTPKNQAFSLLNNAPLPVFLVVLAYFVVLLLMRHSTPENFSGHRIICAFSHYKFQKVKLYEHHWRIPGNKSSVIWLVWVFLRLLKESLCLRVSRVCIYAPHEARRGCWIPRNCRSKQAIVDQPDGCW